MSRKFFLFLDAVWVCCLFLLFYGLFASNHNTLEHNGQWNSTKTLLEKHVVGAQAYVNGTQAFAYNSLHLDAWGGLQELVTKRQFIPSEISFRFLLKKDSYFYAEFGRMNEMFSAFRFSLNPLFPTAQLSAKTSGEFISKTNIIVPLDPETWYLATIRFNSQSKQAQLYINNTPVTVLPYENSPFGSIGFRGSIKPSVIDDIEVKNAEGKTIFTDDFSFWDKKVFIIFLVVASVCFVFWEIFRFAYLEYAHKKKYLPIVLQCVVIVVTVIISAVNFYSIDKYQRIDGIFSFYWNSREDNWKDIEIEKVEDTLSKVETKKITRAVFLGSSQTWGAGADTDTNTFVSQSQILINKKLLAINALNKPDVLGVSTQRNSQEREIEFINAGISGVDSTDLLRLYKKSWKDMLKPDIVVIDLSNNDVDSTKFRANLREFVLLNQPAIKTMFVLEANSMEAQSWTFLNHDIVRQVGKEFDIPIVDLNAYLKTQNDTGILWWDHVHLTTYGQLLAARLLSENILEYISSGSALIEK